MCIAGCLEHTLPRSSMLPGYASSSGGCAPMRTFSALSRWAPMASSSIAFQRERFPGARRIGTHLKRRRSLGMRRRSEQRGRWIDGRKRLRGRAIAAAVRRAERIVQFNVKLRHARGVARVAHAANGRCRPDRLIDLQVRDYVIALQVRVENIVAV